MNLNTVSNDILEALVKYQLQSMTVALDGASNETYKIYRVGGNFEKVIAHIRIINEFKQHYKTDLPKMVWQFVAFGHNEHEIEKARNMAAELKMDFHVKLSFGDLYTGEIFSPIKNRELIRSVSGVNCADRQEYYEKYGERYLQKVSCAQLWENPQIHADGRLLGCSINYKQDYGNVFEQGLLECINNEKINYAREMILGLKPPREDIPCSTCAYYKTIHKDVKHEGISHAHDVVAQRDAQITAIYHSNSWRMTKPLRFVGGKVKYYMHLLPTPLRRLSGRKILPQSFAVNEMEQMTHLEQAVSERDAQIDALYHSTSWQITKPLRFAGDKAKKIIPKLPTSSQRLARKIYKFLLPRRSP